MSKPILEFTQLVHRTFERVLDDIEQFQRQGGSRQLIKNIDYSTLSACYFIFSDITNNVHAQEIEYRGHLTLMVIKIMQRYITGRLETVVTSDLLLERCDDLQVTYEAYKREQKSLLDQRIRKIQDAPKLSQAGNSDE